MKRYPRDMRGHGAKPPNANWPGGAKIAVQIVLNYEEGGENCVLHGDTASEAFLSEITGAAPWPGQRHWNMESVYEYGARSGFWRLHRLLENLPVTVFGVATALARSPEQVAAMKDAGWEIASHGLKWIDYRDHDEEDERADMVAAVKLHTEVVGEAPRGWYTGRCSANTVMLAAELGQFDYIADSYADDLPYYMRHDGRDQLIVPYTLDCNDMRFATTQGFNSGDQFESYLRDSFDALYEDGTAGTPKMMSIGLHCRLIGRPGRVQALKRFLSYVQIHDDVWFATRLQIAQHWLAEHPPTPATRPTLMDKSTFVSTYGDVFEQSPWVAERAWNLELGPAHDSAEGLWSAMSRVFRAASPTQRLEVLDAHPDLASMLTGESQPTPEQSGQWLGGLTDDERQTLTELNEDYITKHGFPFIIALGDTDKEGVFSSLERRIRHDSAAEFDEACRQVERIAQLRLKKLLP